MNTPTLPPLPTPLLNADARAAHAWILRERVSLQAAADRTFARTPSKLDIKGNRKPASSARVNGKTIWFTLYRKAVNPVGCKDIGQWSPVTRTMRKTKERVKMVTRVCPDETIREREGRLQTEGAMAA